MKNINLILKFQIFSGIFTAILGTLLHFTYKWSNCNTFVGVFSAVNESTWEHLKLLFFPMLITTIVGYLFMNKYSSNFVCAKMFGIVASILFTTIFFYTYTGIIGTHFAIVDISSFFIAVILGEYIAYRILISNFSCNNIGAIFILIVLLLCFICFTFFPAKINYFKDPITGQYGISKL